jgi:hypothetical protein
MNRNPTLDEQDDVVLYTHPDGSRHLFRDGRSDGLLLTPDGGSWAATRETYTPKGEGDGEQWALIPDVAPVCTGGYDRQRRGYVARHTETGRVIATHDTRWGLLAKVARFYLRAGR